MFLVKRMPHGAQTKWKPSAKVNIFMAFFSEIACGSEAHVGEVFSVLIK